MPAIELLCKSFILNLGCGEFCMYLIAAIQLRAVDKNITEPAFIRRVILVDNLVLSIENELNLWIAGNMKTSFKASLFIHRFFNMIFNVRSIVKYLFFQELINVI